MQGFVPVPRQMVKRLLSCEVPETCPEQVEYVDNGNGLTEVVPYYFRLKTWTKRRWIGKTLSQVYQSEFIEHPPAYYKAAIELGRITVNKRQVTEDYLIREGDLLEHLLHRHEPPVLSRPIRKIFEDEDVLVVDKVASYQVHPTGRYFHNTLIKRLCSDYGYSFLAVCNRLDRLTSGIVILAKNKETAQKLSIQMASRQVQKEYIAKVDGCFGSGESGGTLECSLPVGAISHKLSINSVHGKDARPSVTIFERISYCPITNTSIVSCKPLTGRTHQIRVHLRYLGNPICNDRLYNNKIWNEELERGKGKCISEVSFAVSERILKLLECKESEGTDTESIGIENNASVETDGAEEAKKELTAELEDYFNCSNSSLAGYDFCSEKNLCYMCENPPKLPDINSLFICLHAYKYKLLDNNQEFVTDLPDWAQN